MTDSVPTEELRPCPFCGALPNVEDISEDQDELAPWEGFWITCQNKECPALPCIRGAQATLAEATELWNRRAAPSAPPMPNELSILDLGVALGLRRFGDRRCEATFQGLNRTPHRCEHKAGHPGGHHSELASWFDDGAGRAENAKDSVLNVLHLKFAELDLSEPSDYEYDAIAEAILERLGPGAPLPDPEHPTEGT